MNFVKGTKKSQFNAATTIDDSAYLDFVLNGQNLRIKYSDLIAGLGVTGSMVQKGDPLGHPVLDIQGTVNAIRNLSAGDGISLSFDPHDGIKISNDFPFSDLTFDTSNTPIVDIPVGNAPNFKSFSGGNYIDITASQGVVDVSVNSAQLTAFLNNNLNFLEIASDDQFFMKNSSVAVSPALLDSDVRLNSYNVDNDSGPISQTLARGGPPYRLLSTISVVNEVVFGEIPDLKTVGNLPQITYLQPNNGVFLFPSNMHTFNKNYVPYYFKIRLTFDMPSLANTANIVLILSLRREIDDSVISRETLTFKDRNANPSEFRSVELKTFVEGESDPFVVDGTYLAIENLSESNFDMDLIRCGIRLYRDL